MCSLCWLPMTKNHNLGQILKFGDSCTDPLLPIRVKFGVLEQTQGLHLHVKFHQNVFIVSASGGQKPQFLADFDLWLAPEPSPFTDQSQIWCTIADPRYTLTCQISSRSVYSVALCWRKTQIFCRFFGLQRLVLSPIGNSWRKLNTGGQLQSFPYPSVSKSFLCSNAFMAKSGAQSLTFKKRDEQSDKETKNSTFLAAPAASEIRAPPNMVR